MKTFADYKIEVPPGRRSGNVKVNCPECEPHRKKKNGKPLSVNVEEGVWYCHNCQWSGSLKGGEDGRGSIGWWTIYDKPESYRKPARTPRPENDEANTARKWWAAEMQRRGIPPAVLKANGVDVRKVWMPQTEQEEWVLAYPYERDGELVNVKYRSREKNFRQEFKAEPILWRLDKIAPASIPSIIITEGENDALAFEVAGMNNAVSVPVGAGDLKRDGTLPNLDGKLLCLEDERTAAILAEKTEIVLALDGDRPGQLLAAEMVRRLGAARCRVVEWPEGTKDANDVLLTHGADRLRALVDAAKPVPLDGVVSVRDIRDMADDVYEFGMPPGPSTGWPSVDRIYRPGLGLMSIITGVPASGKSRFVNALLVNLAKQHDARFAICSPEYRPTHLLVSHLIETYIGKTMAQGHRDRMSREEYERGVRWVDDHFHFIVPETTSVQEILERARQLIARFGVRGLLIDPWTEVEVVRQSHQSEVDALKEQLSMIQKFNSVNLIHSWVVAHPTKLYVPPGEESPRLPGIYDIAGGANWGNKADFILSLQRDPDDDSVTEMHVQKARFQHLAKRGMARLRFQPLTGRYEDLSPNTTGAERWQSWA